MLLPLKQSCKLHGGSITQAVEVPGDTPEDFRKLQPAERDRYFRLVGHYLAIDSAYRLPMCGACALMLSDSGIENAPDIPTREIETVERRRYDDRSDVSFRVYLRGGRQAKLTSRQAAAVAYFFLFANLNATWSPWQPGQGGHYRASRIQRPMRSVWLPLLDIHIPESAVLS